MNDFRYAACLGAGLALASVASAQQLAVRTIETRPNGDERIITMRLNSSTGEFVRIRPRFTPLNADDINDFAYGYHSSSPFYLITDDPSYARGIYTGSNEEVRDVFRTGGVFDTADDIVGLSWSQGLNSLVRHGDTWSFYKFRLDGTQRTVDLDITGPTNFIAASASGGPMYALDSLGDRIYRIDRGTGATTLAAQLDVDIEDAGAGMFTYLGTLRFHAVVGGETRYMTFNTISGVVTDVGPIGRDITGFIRVPAPGAAAALLGFGAFASRRRRG